MTPKVGEVWAIDGPFAAEYVRIVSVAPRGVLAYNTRDGSERSFGHDRFDEDDPFTYRVAGPGEPAPDCP